MKVIAEKSFVQFVYPFTFDREKMEARRDNLETLRWDADGRATPVAGPVDCNKACWQPSELNHEEFLRHISEYVSRPHGGGEQNTAGGGVADKRGAEGCLTYKANPQMLQSGAFSMTGGGAEWFLAMTKKGNKQNGDTERRVGFCFQEVTLVLFRIGVGFMVFRVAAVGDAPEDWFDLIHYFRFAGGAKGRARGKPIGARRKTGKDTWKPFFPNLGKDAPAEPTDGRRFGEILDWFLETGTLNGDPDEGWWKDIFVPRQMLPFSVLLFDDVKPGEQDAVLYRTANFFNSGQSLHPCADDLPPRNAAFMPYADGCWFICSIGGAAYVSINPPDNDFFRGQLLDHVRDAYFTLYLLVLHQRFALVNILDIVSAKWITNELTSSGSNACGETVGSAGTPMPKGPECVDCAGREFARETMVDRPDCGDCPGVEYAAVCTAREQALRRTYDLLLEFNARGYSALAAQRDHHQRFYDLCQTRLRLADLHAEVNDEVGRMHEYVVMSQQRRLEMRQRALEKLEKERQGAESTRANRLERSISFIGTVIAVPSLVCAFLGINLAGYTNSEGISWAWAAGICVTSVLLGLIMFMLLPRLYRE
ncbi:MAG: hypothetical protein WCK89_12685 [bacterium]